MPLPESVYKELIELGCTDCRCFVNSFLDEDILSLDERKRSELKNQLIIRFKDSSIPNFLNNLRMANYTSNSCSLDQANELSCQSDELRDVLNYSVDFFLNRQEGSSCFPPGVIERASFFNHLLYHSKADRESAPFIARLFGKTYGDPELVLDTHSKIKGLSSMGNNAQAFDSYCQDFFQTMDKVFCKNPNTAVIDDVASELRAVELGNSDIEGTSLECLRRECNTFPQVPCDDLSDGYDPSALISSFFPKSIDSRNYFDTTAKSYEPFCPLFQCETLESATAKIYGGQDSCTPAQESRSFGQVIAELGCNSSTPHEICFEWPLSELILHYNPADEMRSLSPEILAQANDPEVTIEQKRQILLANGFSQADLSFLGEVGISRVFGQEVKLSTPELTQEQQRFDQVGRKVAQERQERIQRERRELLSSEFEATRDDRAKKRQDVVAQALRERAQKNNPHIEEVAPERVVDISREAQTFSNHHENLNRFVDNSYAQQAARENREMREIERQIREIEREAMALENQEHRQGQDQRLAEMRQKLEQMQERLEANNQLQDATNSGGGATDFDRRHHSSPANDSVVRRTVQEIAETPRELPREVSREASTRGSNREDGGINATDETSSAAIGSRTPSSINSAASDNSMRLLSSGEEAIYIERGVDELRVFNLDEISQREQSDAFILGISTAEDVAYIEMIPVEHRDEVLYQVQLQQELSMEVKLRLIESPFFEQSVHPDSRSILLEDVRTHFGHSDLIQILNEISQR